MTTLVTRPTLLGVLLVEARNALNMSQRDCADKLDVSSQRMNDFEHGYKLPGTTMLKNMSRVLGINLDVLYMSVGKLPEDIQLACMKMYTHDDIDMILQFMHAMMLARVNPSQGETN
jgi:transcriptional regulator with XRE-family HTH domain